MSFFTGDADDEEESERRMRELVSVLTLREQYDVAAVMLNEVRLMKARRETRGLA